MKTRTIIGISAAVLLVTTATVLAVAARKKLIKTRGLRPVLGICLLLFMLGSIDVDAQYRYKKSSKYRSSSSRYYSRSQRSQRPIVVYVPVPQYPVIPQGGADYHRRCSKRSCSYCYNAGIRGYRRRYIPLSRYYTGNNDVLRAIYGDRRNRFFN
jgi:hypothetical protein